MRIIQLIIIERILIINKMNEGGGTSSANDGHLDSSLSEENHEGSNFIKVDIFDKKEGAQVTDINIFSKQAEQSSRVKP
jgi:hypothetical protein